MGTVRSILTKPLRTFNIDKRAERIISRDKPIPAPSFSSVKKQLQVAQEVSPDFLEKQAQKNVVLDERLKHVYVSSTDQMLKEQTSNKALPVNRSPHAPFEYGVHEPKEVPHGKCTLRQALAFITQHKTNPTECTPESIAQEYHLNKQIVENILKYFGILNRIEPKEIRIDVKTIKPRYQFDPTLDGSRD